MTQIDVLADIAPLPTGAQLAESLDLESLFHAVRDAVVIYDLRVRRVLEWNPEAEALFGYTRAEAIGMPIAELLPERIRGDVMARLADGVANRPGGPLASGRAPAEFPARHKSGREMMLELTATPIGDPALMRVMTIARDCTERHRIECERAALLASAQEHAEQVSELARLKDDFTAMVAHELVAPVSSIRGLAELMGRDDVAEAQRKSLLAMIRSEAGMLQRLVDDIRDAITLEREYFAIALRPVQVSSLLAAAAASAEFMMDRHELVVGEAPHAWVLADAERIGQVLRNLLGNAVKYTPPGTRIELRARRDGAAVVIEVADQGPGIATDDLDRIFAKFVRGRDSSDSTVPGAGLGLYLSRRIVLAHGSDLRVTSAPGTGTVFHLGLKEVQA